MGRFSPLVSVPPTTFGARVPCAGKHGGAVGGSRPMTLEKDLAEWVATRPDWQKDAIARFCRNEVLSAEDVSEIADQLIAGTYPASQGIGAKDVPGTSETGEPARLLAVADVS